MFGGVLAALAVTAAPVAAQVASDDDPAAKLLTLTSIPSATVPQHGTVFLGLSGTNRRARNAYDADGSLSFGAGFGSAEDAIGFQVNGNITSLTDSFGDSGYFGLKASRRLSAGRVPIYGAVELTHLGNWGDASGTDATADVMFTAFSRIDSASDSYPVMFTLGAGTHVRNNRTDPGAYIGAGIGLTEHFGASIAWTGETLDIGSSFTIAGLDNTYFSVEVNDATDRVNHRRITFSVSFALQNAFGR